MTDLEQLRYPVGQIRARDSRRWIARRATRIIEDDRRHAGTFPVARRRTAATTQLDTPYRPGGWTVRQVVHHVPDSHMNAYIRMKFAVTEDAPAIKAYEEQQWAELPEAKTGAGRDVAARCSKRCTAAGCCFCGS